MMLLKTSSRKKTRWWFWGEEKRNQGVEKASRRWSSLFAATMDRLFRYGETAGQKKPKKQETESQRDFKTLCTSSFEPPDGDLSRVMSHSLFTMTVSRQSNRGWRRWCPLVTILWKI